MTLLQIYEIEREVAENPPLIGLAQQRYQKSHRNLVPARQTEVDRLGTGIWEH